MTGANGRETISLGDVLTPAKRTVTIADDLSYEQVTLRIKGRGVTSRGMLSGHAIGTKQQYEVRAGDLLVSKIDARNGGLGLVPSFLQGAVVTSDFPAYIVDAERCLPDYLDLHVRRQSFWDECLAVSEGSTNRVRLVPSEFLELELELPSLTVQRDILAAVRAAQSASVASTNERAALERFFDTYRRDKFAELVAAAEGVAIAEFAELSSGGTPSRRKPEYFGGDIPWVKTGEVAFGPITDTEEHLTAAGVTNSSAKLFPAETVLVAMYGRGTVGRSAYITRPMTTNQACAAIKPGDKHFPLFLFHYLWNAYEHLIDEAEGTTNLTNISLGIVGEFEVPLISLDEQRAIAHHLDRLVAARSAHDRLSRAHAQFLSSLTEELVTGLRKPPSNS